MKLSELRKRNGGTLPACVDGGYPVIYYTRGGLTICADCANKADTSDPVKATDIFYEGAVETCEDCGKAIESAYGDPYRKAVYDCDDTDDCECVQCQRDRGERG